MTAQEIVRSLGPVCIDLEGTTLTEREENLLKHPLVGMVILFTRNYTSRDQLAELTAAIHERRPGIVIAVDHEGGRVQRFREGFTQIPSMRELATGPNVAARYRAAGVVLAATNERALEVVPIEALRQHAVDVPDDISSLE